MVIKSVFRFLSVFLASIFVLALVGCGGGGGGSGSPTGGGTGTGCAATSVPGVPSIYAVSLGNALATVSFSAPVIDGGSAITSYIVTSSPGNFTATGTGTSTAITVNGLTNGTSYTFTIQAVNCLGTGPASTPSTPVTPSTVPDAPTGVSATPGNAQASVAFTPPANNGGATITSYTVNSNPGNITASGAASPIVVTGLTAGTSYTFMVTAANVSGSGPASSPSAAVTPSTVPGAPTGVTARAGNAQASVAFTPPTNNGGLTVGSYTVTSSPGGITATGTASPIAVTGLTNNTAYTFTVTAVNLDGSSAASAPSNSVVPSANPGPYFVDAATGSNANPGTLALPFKTITYALAVAAGVGTANTINVATGIYDAASGETFPLRMMNNVNLVGAGSANTTIDGVGYYSDSSFSYLLITTLVVPPNVTSTVSGFTIAATGAWQMSNHFNVMAVIDAASGTLSNNVLIPPAALAADGVWVLHGANATLTGNTVTGTGWNRGWGALAVLTTPYGNPQVTARSNTISGMYDTAISILGNGTTGSPTVDLGTAASPGNNVINGPATTGVGINIRGVTKWVNASGNTWHANMQGSSVAGAYAVGTIGINPTPLAAGNNYAIGIDLVGTPSAGLQF